MFHINSVPKDKKLKFLVPNTYRKELVKSTSNALIYERLSKLSSDSL